MIQGAVQIAKLNLKKKVYLWKVIPRDLETILRRLLQP